MHNYMILQKKRTFHLVIAKANENFLGNQTSTARVQSRFNQDIIFTVNHCLLNVSYDNFFSHYFDISCLLYI